MRVVARARARVGLLMSCVCACGVWRRCALPPPSPVSVARRWSQLLFWPPETPRPPPHVCGIACGLFWWFRLEGEWLRRRITLTEALGPAISALAFPPFFEGASNVITSDAIAGAATSLEREHSDSLQALQHGLHQQPRYQAAAPNLCVRHIRGWGNGAMGSRTSGRWE